MTPEERVKAVARIMADSLLLSCDHPHCSCDHECERIDRAVADYGPTAERVVDYLTPAWRPVGTAPRCGRPFWGKVGEDAIRMLWHDEFKAFVSSWNQMEMHNGWTFDDGSTKRNHSPVKHEPEAWMPMPESAP